MITQELLKSMFCYSPETGEFVRTKDTYRSVFKEGEIAGYKHSDGAIYIHINYKMYKAHRLAFLYMNGEFPESGVDHIDGNRANNKWANLRPATQAQNAQNLALRTNRGGTGYTGVTFDRGRNKYQAKIQASGKVMHLGRFETAEQAAEAYSAAKLNHHTFNPIGR